MTNIRIKLGKKGEDLTAQYLKNLGFHIIAQNYSSKLGEIDIIAQKEEVVAFVEVKLRHNKEFYLSQLITKSKQNKIIKTAFKYIALNKIQNKVLRFDVALLTYSPELLDQYSINYIENAFTKEVY